MTILLRQLWEELLPHWSKHVKFRPSWLFHKGCLSLHSCQTAFATCWHIELSILGLVHLSIRIHLRISFSCSMKFFHLKITLVLGLGESWPLLAQPRKNTDVHKGMLLCEGFQTVVWQVFCTSFGRSFCHGNEHNGIDPNILSSGHHKSWLFHKGCLSLHTCQTAIFPHVGTLNSAY